MSNTIYGTPVGTPLNPEKIAEILNPVKMVNGQEPDENGNVTISGVTVDTAQLNEAVRASVQAAKESGEFDGDPGGHYVPLFEQVDENTVNVSFLPSKGGMPEVDAIQIELPAGPKGGDGISVTKAEINESGQLVLTFSNNQTVNLGKVIGTSEAVEVFAATPQMFGAKGDGATDDTEAFKAALEAAGNVFLPEGEYLLSEPLQIAQYKSLTGAGKSTVLIVDSPDDFLKFGGYNVVGNFSVRVRPDRCARSLIRVSNDTLNGINFGGSSNVHTTIENIDIEWECGDDEAENKHRAAVEISCAGEFFNAKGQRQVGFYGVKVSNVYSRAGSTRANVGYGLKGYSTNGFWVTGCTATGLDVVGARWTYFSHTSDDDFSNMSETSGIDHLSLVCCQHQATTISKAYVFCRKGQHINITNSVPWDWSNSNGYVPEPYTNHPFCLEYDDLFSTTPNGTKLTITPKANVNQYAGIKTDGTVVGTDWKDEYIVCRNTGLDIVSVEAIPKLLSLQNSIYGACVFKMTGKEVRNRIVNSSASSHYHVHFALFDKDYVLKTVNVRLDKVVSVSTDYPLHSDTKIGYVKTVGEASDGSQDEFKLFVYSANSSNFRYAYVLSMPLYSYFSTAGNMQFNYHKTANTFALPSNELYLAEIPSDMVQITEVSAILSGYVTDAELTSKGYLTKYTETDPTVPEWAKKSSKPSYTANEVGADASGTAQGKVSEHNTASDAHSDIRLLISELVKRVNAVADSDDISLDQLSELVAYIKSNRSLIDGITTGKVSVTDIVDNLTTNVANKPLSAGQGVALKALIDEITVPAKVSQLENDKGYLTSAPVTSVNGKSGAVQLNAEDVGARPSTWTPTVADIGAVPDTDILTMVGVDADGITHTWMIYGKAVT